MEKEKKPPTRIRKDTKKTACENYDGKMENGKRMSRFALWIWPDSVAEMRYWLLLGFIIAILVVALFLLCLEHLSTVCMCHFLSIRINQQRKNQAFAALWFKAYTHTPGSPGANSVQINVPFFVCPSSNSNKPCKLRSSMLLCYASELLLFAFFVHSIIDFCKMVFHWTVATSFRISTVRNYEIIHKKCELSVSQNLFAFCICFQLDYAEWDYAHIAREVWLNRSPFRIFVLQFFEFI